MVSGLAYFGRSCLVFDFNKIWILQDSVFVYCSSIGSNTNYNDGMPTSRLSRRSTVCKFWISIFDLLAHRCSLRSSIFSCWVSGWGKNGFSSGTYQAIQKQVDVPILPPATCQTELSATRLGTSFVFDSSAFICAGGEVGKDACTVSWMSWTRWHWIFDEMCTNYRETVVRRSFANIMDDGFWLGWWHGALAAPQLMSRVFMSTSSLTFLGFSRRWPRDKCNWWQVWIVFQFYNFVFIVLNGKRRFFSYLNKLANKINRFRSIA